MSAKNNGKMVSPKLKRRKTLNNSVTDQNRPIASVTTTSGGAIPYLPDNVVDHILSFLPIKVPVRATAVSKQWASLWPSFPVIDFDEGDPSDSDDGDPSDSDDPAKFQRFLRFLENCMQRCQNQRSLDKLRLRILHSLAGDDMVTIDECVRFALERFVEDLEIRFAGAETEAKVHFLASPTNLIHSTIRITNGMWPFKYYSVLRDCLESFDCSRKVEIEIPDAEGVIIPEHCRKEWTPPLPNVKQLQLTFTNPLWDRDYWLDPSLSWIAPSAEILPHQYTSTIPPI